MKACEDEQHGEASREQEHHWVKWIEMVNSDIIYIHTYIHICTIRSHII